MKKPISPKGSIIQYFLIHSSPPNLTTPKST
uniref:Uncharacterized protein n=1 Tax=Rhizophora mucronata TaxID=61149 RepID=A0A2P2N4P3_RHIMU